MQARSRGQSRSWIQPWNSLSSGAGGLLEQGVVRCQNVVTKSAVREQNAVKKQSALSEYGVSREQRAVRQTDAGGEHNGAGS